MSSGSPSSQRLLVVVLVLLLCAIGAVLVGRIGSQRSSTPAAVASSGFDGPTLPPGLRAASFSLADQNGRIVSLAAYRGHVVVLTFIHSKCQDACPFMVEQIKGALNDLPGSGRGVETIGISVDPAEDTPASRRAFLGQHEMSGRLAFVNGSLAAMKRVWRAYAMQPVRNGPNDHSSFVLLIDKRGFERVGFAADQLTPEGLWHDIARLQRERA